MAKRMVDVIAGLTEGDLQGLLRPVRKAPGVAPEDALQEALLTLSRSTIAVPDGDDGMRLLRSAVQRKIVDHVRKRAREQRRDEASAVGRGAWQNEEGDFVARLKEVYDLLPDDNLIDRATSGLELLWKHGFLADGPSDPTPDELAERADVCLTVARQLAWRGLGRRGRPPGTTSEDIDLLNRWFRSSYTKARHVASLAEKPGRSRPLKKLLDHALLMHLASVRIKRRHGVASTWVFVLELRAQRNARLYAAAHMLLMAFFCALAKEAKENPERIAPLMAKLQGGVA